MALAGAGENVHVDIDQPRCHVEPRDVDGLERRAGSIFGATAAILPARMATSRTSLILSGIDDVAAAQQQIVLLLRMALAASTRKREPCSSFMSVLGAILGWYHRWWAISAG